MTKILISAAVVMMAVSGSAIAADVTAGKLAAQKYNCASCHGADFNSPTDPSYPKLAGQHADYLEQALKSYQRGAKGGGRSNAIMEGQAKQLTKKEVQDIAAYLSTLPGSLVTRR